MQEERGVTRFIVQDTLTPNIVIAVLGVIRVRQESVSITPRHETLGLGLLGL